MLDETRTMAGCDHGARVTNHDDVYMPGFRETQPAASATVTFFPRSEFRWWQRFDV